MPLPPPAVQRRATAESVRRPADASGRVAARSGEEVRPGGPAPDGTTYKHLPAANIPDTPTVLGGQAGGWGGAAAWSRSCLTTASGSSAPKTEDPATNVSTPA